jgi:integrase
MGFTVVARRGKKKQGFRLIEEKWKAGQRSQLAVPVEAYQSLGFRPTMTIEEARARAKQINQQGQLENRAKVQAARRIALSAEIEEAYLPESDVADFESDLAEYYDGKPDRLDNVLKQWNVVKRMLSELALDPKDFADQQQRFLTYYRKRPKPWSPDYVKKLTWVVNQWGLFISRRRGTYYRPLPRLRSAQAQDLRNIREDVDGIKRAAQPLTWAALQAAKASFEHDGLLAHWNWLCVALWFGLRPVEVEGLRNKKLWKVEDDPVTKCRVLCVYQTKLTSVERDRRWKVIPIYLKEQREAFRILEQGNLKKPLNKTLRRLLGEGIETYSPRKGFTDLMLERGFGLEDVSTFLGHQSIEMTWKHYKNRRRFSLPKGA